MPRYTDDSRDRVRQAVDFVDLVGSRVELRKVFWPSRNETFMTTLVVLGFVLLASVFFWLLDLSLASMTKFFTGQSS